jgi:putative serine protease PepD
MQIADELIDHGTVTHAYFGLSTVPVPGSSATGAPQGLFVQAVEPGGPAARAGLQPGDVITEIDGRGATSTIQLETLTLTKRPGDEVAVTYVRDGHSTETSIELGASP